MRAGPLMDTGLGPFGPASVIGVTWLVWVASWFLAAWWQAPVVRRAAGSREILYRVLTTVGGFTLFGVEGRYTFGHVLLWRPPIAAQWILALLVVAGFAITWWARLYLGRLWSSGVTQKTDHRVVDTGPYGWVRHPIYSGLSLSAVATALVRGTAGAWLGAAILILGFYVKARLEEGFLREQLGPAYAAYARRVGMLLPFLFGRSD